MNQNRFMERKEVFGKICYDKKLDKFWRISAKQSSKYDYNDTNRRMPFGDEIPYDLANQLSAPLSVGWKITNRCNALCDHCYASSSPSECIGLSTEKLIKIAENLAQSNVFRVDLCGGEPTLRKNINVLAKKCRDLGLIVVLSTNGYLFNQIKKTIPYLSFLQISLDSLNEKTHDSFRNLQGSWKNAVRCIKRFS